jgi:hypothetical protein
MIQNVFQLLFNRRAALALAACLACAALTVAQDGFAPTRTRKPAVPSLSESTALLEAAVRSLYKSIEPGSGDSSPNDLLAYADLRSLRLYTGALEVAGWSLEQAAEDYYRYQQRGMYRDRGRVTDREALAALEQFQAARETVRTLLQRVRSTAILAEHQISFCDPQVVQEWQAEVLPALRDAIAATDPIFVEEIAYQRYGIPGQTARVIPAGGTGVPADAVDVARNATYQPYEGKGRGQGRYFEVRAYGGPVRVVGVRFRMHERALGVAESSVIRELAVDEVAEPGRPLYIPCNRRRWADVSGLEIEWQVEGRGNRRVLATIDLIDSIPQNSN